jgi:plastocyanin
MKRFAFLSLLLAAFIAACSSGATSEVEPQTITIKAVDIAYDPATIEVAGGQPVRLTMENAGRSNTIGASKLSRCGMSGKSTAKRAAMIWGL